MPSEQTLTQRLNERTLRLHSVEQISLLRNLCLGGAAACLVALTGLLQVTEKSSLAFAVATWTTSLSLPFWITASSGYETYIFLGEESYGHLQTKLMRGVLGSTVAIAGLLLWVGVGSVVAVLVPRAAAGYVVLSVIAALASVKLNQMLAAWWFRDGGPGSV